MAEFSYPFNAVETSPGVYDRNYDASHLARAFLHLQNGVAVGVLGSLIVTAGTGLNTSLATGLAYINGVHYYNDAAKTLPHDVADPTNNRIDYVALRLDTGAREITSTVIKGTPAATPAVPALSNTASIVEIALYEVLVRAGSTQILATDITPTHRSNFFSIYRTTLDMNLATQTGWFSGTNIANGPSGVATGMAYVNQYGNTQTNIRACTQILIDYNTGAMYSRYRTTAGTWSAWVKYLVNNTTEAVTLNGDFIRPNIPYLHATLPIKTAIAANTDSAVPANIGASSKGGWTITEGFRLVIPKTGVYQINMFAEMYVISSNAEMFLRLHQYDAANAQLGSYDLEIKNTYSTPTSWLRCVGAIQLLFNAGEKFAMVVRHSATGACDFKSGRITATQIAGY